MRKPRFRKARGLTVDQDQTQDISPQPLAPDSHLFPGPSPGVLEQRNLPFPIPGAVEGEGDLESHPHHSRVAGCALLIVVVSLVVEDGLCCAGSVVEAHGLSCSEAGEILI